MEAYCSVVLMVNNTSVLPTTVDLYATGAPMGTTTTVNSVMVGHICSTTIMLHNFLFMSAVQII